MVDTMTNFAAERDAMIERQIASRGIREPTILEAFRAVPREEFLSKDYADLAYGDHPLPIEAGQTISQPYIVALMIQAAEMKAGDNVLEVGAGSGYAAAIMSRIAGHVTAIERQPDLVKVAQERMQRLGFDNVRIVEGDGTRGWEPEAPYDSILAAASGSHVPPAWVKQLADGGRIVMPVGEPNWIQKLIKVTKGPAGNLITEDLGGVRFVPLIGEEGWNDA
ncbi:MAG TPA: protein-L-isoaspartate(D-aspartate) O-methyltransferase [Sphingomicrobium sp.]|jgi:protein-L-isoaspartate(D-aspartate) O-methyltransferase|nr:protein-L-isoaspartate(D-aspartate) O-methyltransferase [Sphingomicrobium sp.]